MLEASHPAFGEAAAEAIRHWRFEPGMKDGEVVATRVRMRIPFIVRQ